MIGDVADFVSRLKRVLPSRWFGDAALVGDAVLGGFGVAWSAIYALIEIVRAQARLATASGVFLDMIAIDFFAGLLPRRFDEGDTGFRLRVSYELLRQRATRAAVTIAMVELTGRAVAIFEPLRPLDTGGYNVGGVGYGVGGGWGNRSLPYQCFIIASRPQGAGIAQLAGYDTGGVIAYGSLAMMNTPVTDADIFSSVAAVMPIGYTAWVRIQG